MIIRSTVLSWNYLIKSINNIWFNLNRKLTHYIVKLHLKLCKPRNWSIWRVKKWQQLQLLLFLWQITTLWHRYIYLSTGNCDSSVCVASTENFLLHFVCQRVLFILFTVMPQAALRHHQAIIRCIRLTKAEQAGRMRREGGGEGKGEGE